MRVTNFTALVEQADSYGAAIIVAFPYAVFYPFRERAPIHFTVVVGFYAMAVGLVVLIVTNVALAVTVGHQAFDLLLIIYPSAFKYRATAVIKFAVAPT